MRKINRIKEFSRNHYYAIIIFAFIMIYSCIVPGEFRLWDASDAVLAIHAVDFGMGFCSKLLPGAVYNLFFDSVSTIKTSLYLTALLTAFFAVLSFLLEKFILNVKTEHRKNALIILAFFLTGPSTFAIHVYYPGMLDMYWVFCALLLFVLLSKKQLTPLIFLPFVLCVTVYFSSLICFIPFFVIIVLYKISYTQEKKEKALLWCVLIISTVAAIGVGVYFAVFESENLTYTIDEFHKIYSQKGVEDFFYFDQSLYKELSPYGLDKFLVYTPKTDSEIEKIFGEFLARINYTLSTITLKDKIIVFALILPTVAFIFAFLFNQMKVNARNKCKLKLFCNVCTIVLPFFTLLTSVFFSEDLIRWIDHAFLTLFTSFIYILYKEGDTTWEWVEKLFSKIPFSTLLVWFSFYATTVYHPYYIGYDLK